MTKSDTSLHIAPKLRPSGRSEKIAAAVQQATIEILVDQGIDAVTFENVATVAGINRTTLYRRWQNRNRLITWVLLEYVGQRVPTPDTGSLEKDLLQLMMDLNQLLTTPFAPALFQMMVVEAYKDQTIAQVSEEFWRQRLALSATVIENAIARGEITEDIDRDMLVDVVFGPFYFRYMRDRKPISKAKAVSLVKNGLRLAAL